MAAPTIETIWTGGLNYGATVAQMPAPSGVNAGDLLIGGFSHYLSSGTSPTYSYSGSFTEFGYDENAGYLCAGVCYLKASGGESSTINATTNASQSGSSATFMMRLSGTADPDTDPPSTTSADGSGTGPNPPSHTFSSNDYVIIAFVASHSWSSSQSVSTWPETGNQNSKDQGLYLAFCALCTTTTTGTSYDPSAYTLGLSQEYAVFTIAVPGTGGASFPNWNGTTTYTNINGVSSFTNINGVT